MSYKLSLNTKNTSLTIDDIQLSSENQEKITQFIEEYQYIEALQKHKLPVATKILLHGATGCGKTATAHALGKHLGKEVISLNLGTFISSKLGETARNITEIFKKAYLADAILFIDEFDYIGKSRDYDNKDNSEMKRVVNALLQQIDNLKGETILIAATNYLDAIDSALVRRFQLQLEYNFPNTTQLDNYYKELLKQYPKEISLFEKKYDISFAEAKDHLLQTIKKNVIEIEKTKHISN